MTNKSLKIFNRTNVVFFYKKSECKILTLYQKKTSLLYNQQNEIIVSLLFIIVCEYFFSKERKRINDLLK